MSTPNPIQALLAKTSQAARDQLWLWFVPTVGLTLIASVYCLLRQPTWRATQAFLVRDESGGAEGRQGRFDSIDTMKTAQETILEVARSKVLVEASLIALERPPEKRADRPWPTNKDVEEMRERISVAPSQGAEFGKTEVIHVAVTGPSREEALRRTQVICGQLESHLSDLRRSRAGSVIRELKRSVANAEADLARATDQLQQLEETVGPDLGELRSLNDGAREGNLQQSLSEVTNEIRQAQSIQQANLKLHELLVKAADDPDRFLALPARLLESQPALRRLKEGLVDAQLATSALRGGLTDAHPRAKAAIRSEQEVRQSVHAELASARRGVEADLQVGESQLEALHAQQQQLQDRFDRLATVRAHYGNLVDDRQQRIEILQTVKESLAEAEASQTAAQAASLLTRVGDPEVGNRPIGPSNKVVVLAGFGGGLATGFTLLALSVPMAPTSGQGGRRWSDYVGFGRRSSDRGKRRSEDTTPPASEPAPSPAPAAAADCNRRSHDNEGIPKTDRRYGVRRGEDRPEDRGEEQDRAT